MSSLRIGTCSWKYPSWEGLIYSAPKGINYLEEYAAQYDTVEVKGIRSQHDRAHS